MTKETIQNISLNPKSFLVIGDIMLDRYCNGSINRISPEAPVPVLKYKGEKNILGGAANVATNLVGIGQKVSLMACIGEDEAGKEILRLLHEDGIDSEMVAVEAVRPTTLKTRFVAGNQQLLRVDDESTQDILEQTKDRLLAVYERRIQEFDLVLISDYMKGMLSFDFTQKIIDIANRNGKRVIVDVKDPNPEKYGGAYLLKPNKKELHDLTGMPVETMDEIIPAMKELRQKAGCRCVLATLSADGMAYLDENDDVLFEKSDSRKVYDVVGAGDTAFAYVAAAMAFGFSSKEMLKLANTASSIKVTRFGTAVVSISEVIDELFHEVNKIQTMDTIEKALSGQRHKKIVFTNGCFDILHIGHIRYLKEAKAKGDILVLGLNSDASVKRLKGPSRPVNNERDRMDMLAEMEFIDYVVLFEEDTPYNLITRVKPDILVKGGDYQPDNIVGADFVRSMGGSVEVIPFVEGKSTTNIINAMKRLEQND
ncbi:MAG: D-glycero-beta-D-manno-heptose 1-phosphate adenylyltransferase [Thermoflexaceae bacterium]|nr:D-glycero-beta-D-manno-heptose 1-phosphate adenylyltransferase [Thermoflexaceae bacterium]